MKIIDILKKKEVTLSFEVFPPKTEKAYLAVEEAARQIAALRPDFMSVTYGAGGGNQSVYRQYCRRSAEQVRYHGAGASHLCLLLEAGGCEDDRAL